VHEKFDQLQSFEKIKKEINNQKDFDFLSALLPNLFYEYSKKSELFKDIENIQPDTIRLSQVDDLTLTFFNTTDIKGIYLNYISDKQLDKLNLIEILERFNPNDNKMQLLLFLTLLRLNRFLAEKSTIHIKDHVYEQYLSNLYHWNKKNIMGIRELYKDVIHSIYNWNGKAEKGKINRFIGRNQLKYTISQTIEVEPHLVKEEKRNEDKLEKFLNHMLLEFKVEGKILSITIDYHLFELINKMKYGYRPNNFDKNNFISFVDFVERIIKVGCNDDLIEFKNKVGNNIKSYSLSYDKTFGVYEFKENQL
jgi:DNA phosphorothioation-dependent restriction protein DptF